MAKGKSKKGPTAKKAYTWDELSPGRVQPTAEVAAMIASGELEPNPEVWLNDRYAVIVQRRDDDSIYLLRIRRIDGAHQIPWEIMQRIKDELAGENAEGVELYPDAARRIGVADRWMWVKRPGERWPIGIDEKAAAGPDNEEEASDGDD